MSNQVFKDVLLCILVDRYV